MRTARRMIGVGALVAVVAVGGTGSALAGGPNVRPAQAPPIGAVCNAFDSLLAAAQAARERVEASLATVQARIDGGGLTPRQLAAARAQLALLRAQLRLIDALVARAQAWYSANCVGSSPPPPPPPPPPAPPPAPGE